MRKGEARRARQPPVAALQQKRLLPQPTRCCFSGHSACGCIWACSCAPSPQSDACVCAPLCTGVGTCKPLLLLAAENLNDLYRFDPAALKWTQLSPAGPAPAPRFAMGFAATPDGMLYVFGGSGIYRYSIIS
jgi:hypothetical protein